MVVDGGFAAYEMSGPARQLVHALKYRRIRTVVPIMAAAMADIRERAAFDAAMPVPLHRSRQRKRGFNQAALLLDELRWPTTEGRLLRRKNTESQVGMAMQQRRGNVAGAFVYEGPPLNGARIALVDDVVTTGSTIVECARVLRERGAGGVIVISFARANYQPGTTPDD